MSIYQHSMLGVPTKRVFPWRDILAEYARELGNCPEMTQTEWYKEIAGMAYSRTPEAKEMIEATLKVGDSEFGIKLLRQFFTLPSMPAPDTIPRGLRGTREELVDSGRITIGQDNGDGDLSFEELLTQAESMAGDYNSGIEVRFGKELKRRFPHYLWEENKTMQVEEAIYCPDFLCEKLTLSIEIDSWKFHSDRYRFTGDRRKSRIMQLLGYYHLQFSGPELCVPGGIENALGEIAAFIQRRGLDR